MSLYILRTVFPKLDADQTVLMGPRCLALTEKERNQIVMCTTIGRLFDGFLQSINYSSGLTGTAVERAIGQRTAQLMEQKRDAYIKWCTIKGAVGGAVVGGGAGALIGGIALLPAAVGGTVGGVAGGFAGRKIGRSRAAALPQAAEEATAADQILSPLRATDTATRQGLFEGDAFIQFCARNCREAIDSLIPLVEHDRDIFQPEQENLVCGITHIRINDPVRGDDGGLYERAAILGWIASSNRLTDPAQLLPIHGASSPFRSPQRVTVGGLRDDKQEYFPRLIQYLVRTYNARVEVQERYGNATAAERVAMEKKLLPPTTEIADVHCFYDSRPARAIRAMKKTMESPDTKDLHRPRDRDPADWDRAWASAQEKVSVLMADLQVFDRALLDPLPVVVAAG